jgi:hypothetical protein
MYANDQTYIYTFEYCQSCPKDKKLKAAPTRLAEDLVVYPQEERTPQVVGSQAGF